VSTARRTVRLAAGSLVAGLLLAVVVSPAQAGSVPATEAQIGALESQITAESVQVHQLTAAYDQAAVQAVTLAGELSAEHRTLAGLDRSLATSHAALAAAALASYVGASVAPPLAAVSDSDDPEVSMTYAEVATGNVSAEIGRFQLDQRQVASAEQVLLGEEASDRLALAQAASARRAALAVAVAEQGRLDTLQTELVDEEASAAARAQARSGTQGAPVGNGLVDVVRAQTSASSPSLTAPSSVVTSTTTSPPTTSSPTPTDPTTSPPSTSPPTTSPPPTSPPTTSPAPPSGGNPGGVWLELRECESGDNYRENTGNGYYGAYQFSQQTWTALGYPGRPDLEPDAMQNAAAMKLQAEYGWGQWPVCSAELGLT